MNGIILGIILFQLKETRQHQSLYLFIKASFSIKNDFQIEGSCFTLADWKVKEPFILNTMSLAFSIVRNHFHSRLHFCSPPKKVKPFFGFHSLMAPYLEGKGSGLQEDVLEGDGDVEAGLDAEGPLSSGREAGPVEGEDVLAADAGGDGELTPHLPQLVGFEADLHADFRPGLEARRGADGLVHNEGWAICLGRARARHIGID